MVNLESGKFMRPAVALPAEYGSSESSSEVQGYEALDFSTKGRVKVIAETYRFDDIGKA